ncbi:hypothetical protein [Rugamonas apoptosis]|uniref:Intracellular multiplication protein IcmO n=1 Tax=Rugamonas apoptosis TaxID=2758570 RepID=A0A7W2IN77_9BURK|nr:hypothetical protein [Rugamonas apoptosis]MBA5690540.1 hypothetical protein [Rugamonas apoptosis]
MYINPDHEIDTSALTRDTRTATARLSAQLYRPVPCAALLLLLLAGQLFLAALWPIWTMATLWLVTNFNERPYLMPFRRPKDVGGTDPSDYQERIESSSWLFGLFPTTRTVRTLMLAGGIFFAGYLCARDIRERGRELWFNSSDCRTHLFLAGTTGGGKTETLLGIAYNTLCWGSGTVFGDGKGSATVPFSLWSLCRRLGREDDFLVVNFLTGGVDPFQKMVEREKSGSDGLVHLAQSNTMNPFGDGAADFLLQLVASIIPKASGESVKWQQKAITLMDALFRALCYKRARGEIDISVPVIRHYLALNNLVQLYLEGRAGQLPELAYLPIKAYFETGLPGFRPELAEEPDQWDKEVFNQHGYLTGEFSRILSLLIDTYGYIFLDRYPEVDVPDVLQNGRILAVMIPPLEKSPAEAAALGKLYASQVRLSMARDLGHRLEGRKADVLDTNPTNAPHPYIIINDELANYFAEGMATMFAQARELNYMMVASVQDVQGLKRSDAGAESASVIANTKIKWTLALEDPADTFDLFRKAAGESCVSAVNGHQAVAGNFSMSFTVKDDISVEKHDRIGLDDLKKLSAGEGYLIFKDKVVPCVSFHIPDIDKKSERLPMHINRFIQLSAPRIERMPSSAKRLHGTERALADNILSQLTLCDAPLYPKLDDPILASIKAAASHMNEIERFQVTPVERGIVLFQAARRVLNEVHQSGRAPYWHHECGPEPEPEDEVY